MVKISLLIIKFLTLLLVVTLVLSACKKEMNAPSSPPEKRLRLGEFALPSTFNFSTFSGVDLHLTCFPKTVFKIKGKYGSEVNLLGTYHSSSALFIRQIEVPAFYEGLIIEAYSDDGKREMQYAINQASTRIHGDFTGSQKTATSSLPTNVLYAVNSERDFVVVKTSDFSYETLPDLSAGTIACAVDTFNNIMYYHNSGTMYKYDIALGVHSVAYTNANPFGSGNFPRMEFDCNTQHLFMSNSSTSIKEVDPTTGNVVASYTINGLVNGSSGGDLTFPPNGKRYLACFSGLYELDFSVGNGIVQASRLSAENMPYQLTSAGYDRQGFIYACTTDAQSKMLKLDPQDGSFIIVKTFPMKVNDLGSVVSFSGSICTEDSDGDGICDELDDFPEDSTTCCGEYTPSKLGAGSLAYEDLWPTKGDYDFNDLVVGYNYVQMRNTDDKLVKIKATFQVKAVGASYHNGFGFQLNTDANNIENITGAAPGNGITVIDGKGLEVGQTTPTVIVFEDAYNVINHVGGAYINTDPSQPLSIGQELELEIKLIQPTEASVQPENPFIFVDGVRGHEVHLTDNPPTDLADVALFGLGTDDSDPSSARYYKDVNNVPWAINISHTFRYPREKKRIDEGYNFMITWAMSQGTAYTDWYKDNSGYRNENKLYMKHQ